MARTLPLGLAPEWDRDFTVGVGISVLLHVAVAALVVFLATMAPAPLPPLQSYTVELTDPSALGGRLAFGPLDRPIGRPARVAPASGAAATFGRSMPTPCWRMGAVTMKMMSSTSMTSTRGVTLMSAIESPVLRPPKAIGYFFRK